MDFEQEEEYYSFILHWKRLSFENSNNLKGIMNNEEIQIELID